MGQKKSEQSHRRGPVLFRCRDTDLRAYLEQLERLGSLDGMMLVHSQRSKG